jgi:hypothetical protein
MTIQLPAIRLPGQSRTNGTQGPPTLALPRVDANAASRRASAAIAEASRAVPTDRIEKQLAEATRQLRRDLSRSLPQARNWLAARIRPVRRKSRLAAFSERWGVAIVAAVAGLLGAGAALLFDPDRGRTRRAYLRDRSSGLARRFGRRAVRWSRFAGASMVGLGRAVTHLRDAEQHPDDVSLAHKVETELFRDPSVDKGRMNINVEHGIVVLRGVAESPGRIEDIERRTRRIDGVRDVHNLLHLPGTPAPGEGNGGRGPAARGGERVPVGTGRGLTP